MPDPIETLYVEIAARADQLIRDVEKAVKTAENRLKRIEEATEKQESAFTKLGTVIKGVFALKVVQIFIQQLQKVLGLVVNITQQAVGLASSYESVMMTFNRLLGSEQKSLEFIGAIREQAAAVGQNFIQMALAAKMFLPYAEGSKDAFLAMIQAQMGLAAADPFQGMQGAALALREFLSGTYLSLAQRFELPRKKLAQILKDHKDIESRMVALNELLAEFGMGFTLVSEQAGTLPGILGQIRGVWSEALLALGQPVMEELRDQMSDLLTWVLANKEEIIRLATEFGEWIAKGVTGVRDLIEKFVELGKSVDTFMTSLRGPTWLEDWIVGVQRLGALIDMLLVDSVSFVAQTLEYIGTNLQRIAAGEALVPLSEYLAKRGEAKKEAWMSALERWGLARREAPEVEEEPPAEEEVAPEEEVPFALGEKAQKALAQGAQKIERILQKFQKKIESLRKAHVKKIADIDKKEQKAAEKAQDKYLKGVTKLQRDYEKKQIKAEKEYRKERIRDQEDFNKEWKRLIRDQHQSVLDAEWEFRFEEERLIAEGDTLALRELRLRYQHEKEVRAREQQDARSDTTDAQKDEEQDRREDFREAQAEREAEFTERMAALEENLQDQLTTITENAEEARQKENEAIAERMADAQQSRDEELARIGEWLANVKGVNAEELDAIKKIWAEVYGDIANKGIEEGLRAHNERMRLLGLEKQAAADLANAYAGMEPTSDYIPGSAGAGGRGRPGRGYIPGSGGAGGRGRRRAQYGLDEIFNRPTSILVGEGGMPEHVQVTPLGGGGMGGISGRLDINVTVSSAGALSPEAESGLIISLTGALESAIEARETR